MKLNVKFLQEGGMAPEAMAPEAQGAPAGPEAAPQEGGAEAQLQEIAGQLVEMLMQQIGDPQAVMAILQMAMEMVGQAAQPQQPAFQRQGGRLVRIK